MPALRATLAAALVACAAGSTMTMSARMSAMSRLEQDSKWLFAADAADAEPARQRANLKPRVAALPKKTASLLASSQTVADALSATAKDEDTPKGVPPLISKLKGILAELKERRDNIKHLEKTLAQEKTMLQEGQHMFKLATTKKGKHTFERQVQSSEQIVKDTAGLLADGRKEALAAAQGLIKEMEDAQELGSSIITEAKGQLNYLEDGASTARAPAQKAQQADDDSQDADDQDDDSSDN